MEFKEIGKAFAERKDLEKYGQNALMLWALQIRYGIDDVDTFAATCLTDGKDDKKCDLIWINRDEGFALIAQSFYKKSSEKGTAPANKASDLNTAIAWVLGEEPLDSIP